MTVKHRSKNSCSIIRLKHPWKALLLKFKQELLVSFNLFFKKKKMTLPPSEKQISICSLELLCTAILKRGSHPLNVESERSDVGGELVVETPTPTHTHTRALTHTWQIKAWTAATYLLRTSGLGGPLQWSDATLGGLRSLDQYFLFLAGSVVKII